MLHDTCRMSDEHWLGSELLYTCRNSPMEEGYYAGNNHKHVDWILLHTR